MKNLPASIDPSALDNLNQPLDPALLDSLNAPLDPAVLEAFLRDTSPAPLLGDLLAASGSGDWAAALLITIEAAPPEQLPAIGATLAAATVAPHWRPAITAALDRIAARLLGLKEARHDA